MRGNKISGNLRPDWGNVFAFGKFVKVAPEPKLISL